MPQSAEITLEQIRESLDGGGGSGAGELLASVLAKLGPPPHSNCDQVTTGASAQVVPSRATRRRCVVRNLSTTITIYVGPASKGTITANNGMPILPLESYPWISSEALHAVAASGSPVLAYEDSYD